MAFAWGTARTRSVRLFPGLLPYGSAVASRPPRFRRRPARCWRTLGRYGSKVLADPEETHDGLQRRTQVFEPGRNRRLDVLIVHLAV